MAMSSLTKAAVAFGLAFGLYTAPAFAQQPTSAPASAQTDIPLEMRRGHGHSMYHKQPRRHYGWTRGKHKGWYKHPAKMRRYR